MRNGHEVLFFSSLNHHALGREEFLFAARDILNMVRAECYALQCNQGLVGYALFGMERETKSSDFRRQMNGAPRLRWYEKKR